MYTHPESEPDLGQNMIVHSRRASAMLSEQSHTPHVRRTSIQVPSTAFQVEYDGADGEKLASRYQMLEELGSGSFGVVYKAIEKCSGEIVAIKHVDLESSEEDLIDILSELTVLSSCASSHVTKYRRAFLRKQTLWIVMEYLGGGSCADLLKPPPHSLSESYIAIICRELLLGLAYLHSEGKIHRDIKAANILLGMDGRVKLADFGVATQLTGLKSIRHTFVGTPFWMAPEVIQQEGHDTKADIWSLGITAMELANGEPPHANVHPMKVLFLIPKQNAPRLEGSWSRDFKDFVAACLTKDIDKRPSAKELLRHKFVRNAGKVEGLQELILQKQEWDASRGAEKNMKYYAETLRQLKPGVGASPSDDEDDWVFDTVKAVSGPHEDHRPTQRMRKPCKLALRDEATEMMEDLTLDKNFEDTATEKPSQSQRSYSPSPSPMAHRSNTKKRLSSTAHRLPLGVNTSFGNSPSTVRQFRRVSPSDRTPDLENDDPLQMPKKKPYLKQTTDVAPREAFDPATKPLFLDHSQSPRPSSQLSKVSRHSSNASTLAPETKERNMGRRLYTAAIGISCQEVLNETGDEQKREAIARVAEAFSDLEAIDPEGMYHIMQSILVKMSGDVKLREWLLPTTTAVPEAPRQTSGTVVRSQPSTPSKEATPLRMAQNNPHLKSHRRRQSAQIASRETSSVFSSPRSNESAMAEKKLKKLMSGNQLDHTKAMADVMFETWCEGLRNRWPAV